ncbi:nas-29, partial [Pristionchus pacificus]
FLFLFTLPSLIISQTSLSEILRRSDRSRLFDTLTEIVHEEYKDKGQSSDQIVPVQYQRREASIAAANEKLQDILYEGDILVTPQFLERVVDASLRRQGNRLKRQAFLDATYPMSIWTEGVPYVLHPSLSLSSRASIQRAISFWHEETCINFRPRTNEVQYLNFVGNGDGCWSSVGRDTKSGPQPVSIGAGCSHFGVTSHELAHALGLFHEQSRYDRDRFVTLNTNRVPRRLLYNFAKIGDDELTTYSLPYDVGSVMHYAPTEFAIDRRFPALTSVDPNLQFAMGNLYGPTFVDVALLNVHYNCASKCRSALNCANGGYIDSRKCDRCKCPSGFGGRLCDEVDVSFSQNCGGIVQVGEDVRRFTITIRQSGMIREKDCIYHFVAPPRRRILINVLQVDGTCVEGCHLDTAEFKMVADLRPVGYRLCCNEQRGSRLVSVGNIVPAIFQSTRKTYSIRFEYTLQAVRTKRRVVQSDMQQTIVDVEN